MASRSQPITFSGRRTATSQPATGYVNIPKTKAAPTQSPVPAQLPDWGASRASTPNVAANRKSAAQRPKTAVAAWRRVTAPPPANAAGASTSVAKPAARNDGMRKWWNMITLLVEQVPMTDAEIIHNGRSENVTDGLAALAPSRSRCHTPLTMTLRIDVLGTPQIDVDGAPLRVDTRKATALLAYLAVTGGPQARDLLVELLWPDTDPDRGRSALRRTLSTLRSALGQRWLAVTRSAVALDVEPDAIDVRRFRRLAAAGGGRSAAIACLSEAVALHRGDLLAGFGLRDSVAFDDWQRSATAELRGELELALDRLVAPLAQAGRSREGIPHAPRRPPLHPNHQPAPP